MTSSGFFRSPPKFPEVILSEVQCLKVAHIARKEINEAFYTLRNVASGKDLKTYLMVISLISTTSFFSDLIKMMLSFFIISFLFWQTIAVLWFISIVGSCFSFLTLSYTSKFLIYTTIHYCIVLYINYFDWINNLNNALKYKRILIAFRYLQSK